MVEAMRRMSAPWVVITLFLVILAFTHWFIRADERVAGLSKMYVNALSVLTTILLLMMVGIVSPISLPNDIETQTVYTVVSKPVRRLEMIWGRLLGYMAWSRCSRSRLARSASCISTAPSVSESALPASSRRSLRKRTSSSHG